MSSITAIAAPVLRWSPTKMRALGINASRTRMCGSDSLPTAPISISYLSKLTPGVSLRRNRRVYIHPSRKAGTSLIAPGEFTEEPETKVEFQVSLSIPGCPSTLSLIGTGYREKVFAIIGVKVYAAGFYANPSIFSKLDAWKARSAAELQQDSSLFDAIFHADAEKSLQIILVRDVDGKTFWDALDQAVSPRIASPNAVDESALLNIQKHFSRTATQERNLRILDMVGVDQNDCECSKTHNFDSVPHFNQRVKMSVFFLISQVCVSSDKRPSSVDATIESSNVTSALFDVFLGDNPVSPSLKVSASKGLAYVLN